MAPGQGTHGPGALRAIDHARLSERPDLLITGEYLVANGQGGFASATLSGALTRGYHGVLAAALPEPLGRTMMLSHPGDRLRLPDGTIVDLSLLEATEAPRLPALQSFTLEDGLPVWRYRVGVVRVEKRLVLPHRQNIVHVSYTLTGGSGATLLLRPMVNFRPVQTAVSEGTERSYHLVAIGQRQEIEGGFDLPELRLKIVGAEADYRPDPQRHALTYREEEARGYTGHGHLWSPGEFAVPLREGVSVVLIAGTDPWREIDALPPVDVRRWEGERRRRLLDLAHPAAREGMAAELVLAADAFLMAPMGRTADVVRAHATGDQVRSIIAGYHWFTDWGRDTMIALEGLTLTTGRPDEAAWILRTFAHHVRRGLIPNLFPEGEPAGVYHTADATLWLFHALARHLAHTGDRAVVRDLLPTLVDIVEHHRSGTDFGIGIDPADGLLVQGAAGYALTWMDARAGDWVVTPRRGKAVEINALWYNALRHLGGWLAAERGREAAAPVQALALQVRASFNRRFWNPATGHLFDLVDGEAGDDPACRPNQIFALSLDHAVLDRRRWRPVLEAVRRDLLTPVGLRSLAPGHPDYRPVYTGDVLSRDGAYHQGTVWGWLIGPFVDAHLRVHPDDRAGARELLAGFAPHLSEAGIGTIAEVFDAAAPHAPRGCIAQAWSVAEVLRAWVRTAAG